MWEYNKIRLNKDNTYVARLNTMGRLGWELVETEHLPYSAPNEYECLFKRKLEVQTCEPQA